MCILLPVVKNATIQVVLQWSGETGKRMFSMPRKRRTVLSIRSARKKSNSGRKAVYNPTCCGKCHRTGIHYLHMLLEKKLSFMKSSYPVQTDKKYTYRCIYTYTYIHIHIHTHTYTYTYIHTHTYTYTHTHTHRWLHSEREYQAFQTLVRR